MSRVRSVEERVWRRAVGRFSPVAAAVLDPPSRLLLAHRPSPAASGAVFLLGAVAARWIVSWSDDRTSPYLLWVSVAVALGVLSAATGILGLRVRAELRSDPKSIDSWDRLAVAAAATTVLVTIAFGTETAAGSGLVVLMLLGATPALAAVFTINLEAATAPAMAPHAAVLLLSDAWACLRQLLLVGGATVSLSILALGVSASREGTDVTLEDFFMFGGAGTLMLAALYAPAAITIRRRLQEVLADIYPSPSEGEPPASIIAVVKQRRDGAREVLGESTIYGDLTKALVVLAPLVSGFIGQYITDLIKS